MNAFFKTVAKWIGVELDAVSHREKIVSAVGGVAAIMAVVFISHHALHHHGATLIIASMGASAVLLFAVPHGQLSQPWPVFAGHMLSAAIGVTCARYIPSLPLAAGCAVGLSIGVMHHFKCIHPPGGATALTAVIGGSGVTSLGYGFLWSPVLQNVLVMLLIAIAFNAFFSWRRYPAVLNRNRRQKPSKVTHDDVVAALRSVDSFVDISEDDLLRLIDLLETKRKNAVRVK